MIHIKRIGFLLLMALMGVIFLILHYSGYLLGWRFYTDNSYWFPIAYSVNFLLMAASVFFVFWLCRHFLFGRGRPWLAWFCMACWLIVWGIIISKDVKQSTAIWTSSIYFGSNALSKKVNEVQNQHWSISMMEIKNLPVEQRERICTSAILNGGGGRTEGQSEGIPLQFNLPEDMIGKGLMETQICSSDLVQKFKKLKDLSSKFNEIQSQEMLNDDIDKEKSFNHKVFFPSRLDKLMAGTNDIDEQVAIYITYTYDLKEKLHTAMLETKICSSDLVLKFKELRDLKIKFYRLLTQEDYRDRSQNNGYNRMRLLSHPDALTQINETVRDYKNKPIDLHIAINEMSLRNITTKGQHEHVWVKLEGLNNEQIKTVSIDPRIWPVYDHELNDSWYFWKKTESIHGDTAIEIDQMECQKEL